MSMIKLANGKHVKGPAITDIPEWPHSGASVSRACVEFLRKRGLLVSDREYLYGRKKK